jgi:C-terminal processing protease CtpA/Prc
VEKREINALPKDSIGINRQKRYKRYFSKSSVNQGITLELDNPGSTGILTIKSLDRDILRSRYKQDFDIQIQKAFRLMENSGITHLILDLRDNQGGEFGPGRLLLSYLLKNPFEYLKNSKEYQRIQPRKNGFKGELYILINGGSFSSTAILCSYLEQTGRGIFIGEETGGNRNLIYGDPVDLVLPNTHISCSISTTKYLISNKFNDGHGIVPLYRINPVVGDILRNRDPAKKFAMKLALKELH